MEIKGKKSKKGLIICVIIAVIAIIAGVAIYSNSSSAKISRHLKAGDKYMNELKYDEAVASYLQAFEIDPKNEETCDKLVAAYIAWAESYVEVGKYEKALSIVAKGLKRIDDSRLLDEKEKIEKLMGGNDKTAGADAKGDVEEDEELDERDSLLELIVEKGADEKIYSSCGGVMIVKEGELYGAVDYDGNRIVPCEYNSYRSANKAGYFVMTKTVGKDEWGDDLNEYYLFDKNGKEVLHGPDIPVATSDMIVVRHLDEFGMVIYYYYDYSGKKVATVETNFYDSESWYWPASYDGYAVVKRRTHDETYYGVADWQNSNGYTPCEIGFVSPDGKIKWIDEDGLDESNPNQTLPKNEFIAKYYPGTSTWGYTSTINAPRTGVSQGYFLTYTLDDFDNLLVDTSGNIVSAFNFFYIDLSNPENISWNVEERTLGTRKYKYYSTDDEEYPFPDVVSFYYDGAYQSNYGTKVVISDGDRYGLLDMNVKGDKPEIKMFDYLAWNYEKYWLASVDGKWGYTDHDGNVVKLYDDASAFYDGYALIVENGVAYLIDDKFKKLEEVGEADRVFLNEELLALQKDGTVYYYKVKTQK